MRVWLVTGTSSGFVSFIVDEALDRGDKVLIASPTPDTLPASLRHPRPNLALHRLDGTDDAHAEQAVHATVAAFGRIDVVLTIAGLGLVGAIEEVSDAELRMMFTTNVFDQLTTVRAALPVLRAQRAGHLIVMSALGGSSELPGWGVYQATKFASQGICEALSTELRPLGIGVTYLEPGLVHTDFGDGGSVIISQNSIDDYDGTAGKARRATQRTSQSGHPAKIARVIVDVAGTVEPPLLLPLGSDATTVLEARLKRLTDNIDTWRDVALSTDRDTESPGQQRDTPTNTPS